MSYRCLVCRDVTPPNQPLLKRVIYRPNGQIEREVPVCQACDSRLPQTGPVPVAPTYRKPDPATLPQGPVHGRPVEVGERVVVSTAPPKRAAVRVVCDVCGATAVYGTGTRNFCSAHAKMKSRR